MDIFGKIRKYLFPLIIVIAIFVMVVGAILNTIKNTILEYHKEMILTLGTGVFVVPIVVSLVTGWEIPGILIFYDFIFGFVVLLMMVGLSDGRQYEREGGYNDCYGYQNPTNINRTYNYNNPYFNPVSKEKERNGGFTDKEVQEKKQLIRKKLEKSRLLDKNRKKEGVLQ